MADEKPVRVGINPAIWAKVNKAIMGENAAETVATIISGLSMLLVAIGVAKDELEGRVHLAAIILSPTPGGPGALVPQLYEQLARLGWKPE